MPIYLSKLWKLSVDVSVCIGGGCLSVSSHVCHTTIHDFSPHVLRGIRSRATFLSFQFSLFRSVSIVDAFCSKCLEVWFRQKPGNCPVCNSSRASPLRPSFALRTIAQSFRDFADAESLKHSAAQKERVIGNDAYKINDYDTAIRHYTLSLDVLPDGMESFC